MSPAVEITCRRLGWMKEWTHNNISTAESHNNNFISL